ncbi:hypothetical protein [Nonomuraea sp. B1E8]|uniref:hypothetical protein n=1 Tax=unclassified Nonomuraea TaxID=2593643 RepID=UPI00325D696F
MLVRVRGFATSLLLAVAWVAVFVPVGVIVRVVRDPLRRRKSSKLPSYFTPLRVSRRPYDRPRTRRPLTRKPCTPS